MTTFENSQTVLAKFHDIEGDGMERSQPDCALRV